jgi:hypothetical protein
MHWQRQVHLKDPHGKLWCRRLAPGCQLAFNRDSFMALPYNLRCQECQAKLLKFEARGTYNPNGRTVGIPD